MLPIIDEIDLARPFGIEWKNNSCYIDTTLVSMFLFTDTYDDILTHVVPDSETPEKTVLAKYMHTLFRDRIITPLRRDKFVSGDTLMDLRVHMQMFYGDLLNDTWITDEMEQEEFILALFRDIFGVAPFFTLNNDAFYAFLMFSDERDKSFAYATYQNLFDQCCHRHNNQFLELPKRLILTLPRTHTKNIYRFTMPTLYLDITDTIDYAPKGCCCCGKTAQIKCKDCYGIFSENRDGTFFCNFCLDKCHLALGNRADSHVTEALGDMLTEYPKPVPPRHCLELHAVVCIHTHHYVCFNKDGEGPDAEWFYFNSMISSGEPELSRFEPRVAHFKNFHYWNSKRGKKELMENQGKVRDPLAKLFFCHPYVLFYRKPKQTYF